MSGNSGQLVAIRYQESSRVIIEGTASRRLYQFSAATPVQMVDSRDVPALLSTRFFVREK